MPEPLQGLLEAQPIHQDVMQLEKVWSPVAKPQGGHNSTDETRSPSSTQTNRTDL